MQLMSLLPHLVSPSRLLPPPQLKYCCSNRQNYAASVLMYAAIDINQHHFGLFIVMISYKMDLNLPRHSPSICPLANVKSPASWRFKSSSLSCQYGKILPTFNFDLTCLENRGTQKAPLVGIQLFPQQLKALGS